MKFSITIPAYKQQYLQEAIESVLTQTFSDFELIIVNDASPQNLDEVVSHFHDPRIKYYKNEKNCGAVNVVDNWNICLSHATGDYVICMGDDDKLLPNCLEEYKKLIEKHPGLGLYHGWTELIDEDSHVTGLQSARPEFEDVYSLIWHRWQGRQQYIGDFLFDTKLLKKNGGFYKVPLAWGSDDISAVIASTKSGVANTQVPVFQYRQNIHTISRTGNIKIKMDAIIQERNWYGSYLKEEPTEHIANIYWKMILSSFKRHFEKKMAFTIAEELKMQSRFYIVYWMFHAKKYSLNMKTLCFALLQSFK